MTILIILFCNKMDYCFKFEDIIRSDTCHFPCWAQSGVENFEIHFRMFKVWGIHLKKNFDPHQASEYPHCYTVTVPMPLLALTCCVVSFHPTPTVQANCWLRVLSQDGEMPWKHLMLMLLTDQHHRSRQPKWCMCMEKSFNSLRPSGAYMHQ